MFRFRTAHFRRARRRPQLRQTGLRCARPVGLWLLLLGFLAGQVGLPLDFGLGALSSNSPRPAASTCADGPTSQGKFANEAKRRVAGCACNPRDRRQGNCCCTAGGGSANTIGCCSSNGKPERQTAEAVVAAPNCCDTTKAVSTCSSGPAFGCDSPGLAEDCEDDAALIIRTACGCDDGPSPDVVVCTDPRIVANQAGVAWVPGLDHRLIEPALHRSAGNLRPETPPPELPVC